jgi:surfactin synthase thioesterase subunit
MKETHSSTKKAESIWIGQRRKARAPRVRLIAFPYAGGGASVFRRWVADLEHSEWLDFAVVQLPGREDRVEETPHRDLTPLLNELEPALEPLLAIPYILFGYSMGALLAYELALRFTFRGKAPQLLMVAARTPPHRMKKATAGLNLGEDAIMNKVRRLGGSAPGLIESKLFEEHFLPILQADFELVDSFSRSFPQILPCKLLTLAGSDDPEVPLEQSRAWAATAGGGFDLKIFKGGHFFLHSAHDEVISFVNRILTGYELGRYANPNRAGEPLGLHQEITPNA